VLDNLYKSQYKGLQHFPTKLAGLDVKGSSCAVVALAEVLS